MTCKSRAAMGLNTARGHKLIKPKFTINKTTCANSEIKSICKSLTSLEFFPLFLHVERDFTSEELKIF